MLNDLSELDRPTTPELNRHTLRYPPGALVVLPLLTRQALGRLASPTALSTVESSTITESKILMETR
jgi:hypothetical protein